jgi:hypothetical protein
MSPSFTSQTNSHQSSCRKTIAHSFFFDPSSAFVSPINCTISPCSPTSPASSSSSGSQECSLPKVLFYGAVHKSDADRRLRLCELMTREVPDFGCFEGVFGPSLDVLIDHASVIVLDRFYDISALESHRIDPLLLRGKVLVSTNSFGQSLTPPYPSSPPLVTVGSLLQMWFWITSIKRRSPL